MRCVVRYFRGHIHEGNEGSWEPTGKGFQKCELFIKVLTLHPVKAVGEFKVIRADLIDYIVIRIITTL